MNDNEERENDCQLATYLNHHRCNKQTNNQSIKQNEKFKDKHLPTLSMTKTAIWKVGGWLGLKDGPKYKYQLYQWQNEKLRLQDKNLRPKISKESPNKKTWIGVKLRV